MQTYRQTETRKIAAKREHLHITFLRKLSNEIYKSTGPGPYCCARSRYPFSVPISLPRAFRLHFPLHSDGWYQPAPTLMCNSTSPNVAWISFYPFALNACPSWCLYLSLSLCNIGRPNHIFNCNGRRDSRGSCTDELLESKWKDALYR